MNITRSLPRIVLAVLLGLGPALAQDGDPAARALARLSSVYESERNSAVDELLKLDVSADRLVALLASPEPRFRVGAATVLARATRDRAALEALRVAYFTEEDRVVKVRIGERFLEALFRSGTGGALFFREITGSDAPLARAAARFVEREIRRLDARYTPWSDYRRLGRFAALGPYAGPALIGVVKDTTATISARCLAAMALGRVDQPGFWVGDDGGVGPELKRLLDDGDPQVKMALLYAASCSGPTAPGFIREVVRFALEDAFGEDLIQASLYYLYCLPDRAVLGEKKALVRCFLEYRDPFHSQKVHYNAGELLKRLRVPDDLAQTIELIKEQPTFASYWLIVGVMNGLAALPDGKGNAMMEDLITWGLSDAVEIPQLRGLAAWYRRDRDGKLPEGLDLSALLADIRSSTLEVRSTALDPDFYAQRSGVEILSLLGDAEAAPVIAKMLEHESEAVRMAAGIAVGNGKYEQLEAAARKVTKEEEEFSSFGAAYGLKLLGKGESVARYFCRLLESGNVVLMRAARQNLRDITGHEIVKDDPVTQAGWRHLAERWRAHLATR